MCRVVTHVVVRAVCIAPRKDEVMHAAGLVHDWTSATWLTCELQLQ